MNWQKETPESKNKNIMKETERTTIGLGGEFDKDVLSFMRDVVGMKFTACDKQFLHKRGEYAR